MIRRRRNRTRGLATGLVTVTMLAATAWAAGLVWFAGQIPDAVADRTTRTDAIIVLTGGQGRLETGLDLLGRDLADRLFVSGVYRGVDVKTLLGLVRSASADLEDRIGIGDAANTTGNAEETAEWVRRNGVRSIRLVTSSYHMPRSLAEFRHALPDIEIVPHPIFSDHVKQREWWAWPGTAALIAREYVKYLFVKGRYMLDGLDPKEIPA